MAYTTIKKPSDYFNTKLWSGNGSSQALTGVGHQTDMVWIKSRTDTRKHNLYDVVRGVQKRIVPNDTVAEDTATGVTAFGTDGFTVGSETDTNGSSRNFVGWSWNANGAGVANTDGTISSTVSANTTSGFSIVTYSGTGSAGTVGHGLGVAPSMIIVKVRTGRTASWLVYHKGIASDAETDFLKLESTDAAADEATIWNDTAPTSSVFSVGTEDTVSGSGNTFVAYCFAEKQGFSKFGSYLANAQTGINGPFIYLGFKPSLVIIKNTAATGWYMYDNKRNPYNRVAKALFPDSNAAEYDYTDRLDFLSNGFAIRGASASTGDNSPAGQKYIYIAFAEEPLVGDNPATAR